MSQGKLILLLAGRPTCSYCIYMKETVCEGANVRPLIDEVYVPWFSDIDVDSDYLPYATNLGGFTLPMSCMIEPRITNSLLWRVTGPYTAGAFEDFLRLGARLAPPQADNLVSEQVIQDIHYQVTGHIWTNVHATGVLYRVTVGTNTAGAFSNATGATNWIAPLAPYVAAGVSNRYTFEVYARFANGTTSGTNRLVFGYQPAVTLRPSIGSTRVDSGVLHLALTNLTAGMTNRVERCWDLGQTNGWTILTNLVSTGSGSDFAERVDASWRKAFYRISVAP